MNRLRNTFLGLLLALGIITAQYLPTDARVLTSARVPFIDSAACAAA